MKLVFLQFFSKKSFIQFLHYFEKDELEPKTEINCNKHLHFLANSILQRLKYFHKEWMTFKSERWQSKKRFEIEINLTRNKTGSSNAIAESKDDEVILFILFYLKRPKTGNRNNRHSSNCSKQISVIYLFQVKNNERNIVLPIALIFVFWQKVSL